MDQNLLKPYKFLFVRRSLHHPSRIDVGNVTPYRATLPKYVIANKNPAPAHYIIHRPNSFEGLMDSPDITYKTKSLTEARWSQVIVEMIKDIETVDKVELAHWQSKVADFQATGIYTYLELMR